jgi:hypothetical protein
MSQIIRRIFILTLLFSTFLAACAQEETGSLQFLANGEDFVRQGFVSKDGWAINFDQVVVNLQGVTAYQTDPPFDSATGSMPEGESVAVAGTTLIDLAAGDTDAEPILLETVEAPVGQYNAISWEMVNGDDGYTLLLVGTAAKDGETIPFNIRIDEIYQYVCGEYVGDERKGFVDSDAVGDVEMTFHFDHVFGDADTAMEEPLNVGALGFDPLAALAENGSLSATQADLEAGLSSEAYATLMDTLGTLGHVGEGHCYEAEYGHTGHGAE